MKGLWIPVDILRRQDLSHAERLVAAFILSFDQGFFGSNQYIANSLAMNKRSVERLMLGLKSKGIFSRKKTTQFCGNDYADLSID